MRDDEVTEQNVIKATGIDGCNILIFDGKAYADSVAKNAEKLHMEKGTVFATEYLKAMQGLTVKIENCTATFDNSTKK